MTMTPNLLHLIKPFFHRLTETIRTPFIHATIHSSIHPRRLPRGPSAMSNSMAMAEHGECGAANFAIEGRRSFPLHKLISQFILWRIFLFWHFLNFQTNGRFERGVSSFSCSPRDALRGLMSFVTGMRLWQGGSCGSSDRGDGDNCFPFLSFVGLALFSNLF